MNDWFRNMEREAQKISDKQKMEEKLTTNYEYQNKLKELDIKLGLVNKKMKELIYEKEKLKVEYGNKELENMGSIFRLKLKDPNNPFDGLFE